MKTYIIIPFVLLILAGGLYFSNRYEHQTNADEINMYRCSHAASIPFLDSIWDVIHSNKKTFNASQQDIILKKEGYDIHIQNTDFESIPDNAFENYPCIESALLPKNKFKTIPNALRDLTYLQTLVLSENNLTTLETKVFESLHGLKNLYFSNNPIKKFTMPATQSELTSIECQYCELTEIDFIPFTMLRNLDLSYNQLTTFPIDVFNFTGLNTLRLDNNQIGNFDFTKEEIKRFSYRGLNSIDLSNNKITRFPTELGNITNLQHLNLYQNNITGKLVTEGFLFLEKLELPNHSIEEVLIRNVVINNYGEESKVDYFLSSIQELILNNNQIKSFEVEGGENESIHTINLESNQLTTFPEALGQFKKSQNINLSDNFIRSVYLPEGFQAPILNLNLSYNKIKEITTQVNKAVDYEKINLSHNQLTQLPSQLMTNSNIKRLDLSYNRIKALHIEDWFGFRYIETEELDLSHNPISKWNSDILILKYLRVLDLSYTDIEEIPINDLKEMENLEKLIIKGTKIPKQYIIIYELLDFDVISK